MIAPNGVLPRLLRLNNGMLVLSSGRPGVQLRFSVSGLGDDWSEPVDLLAPTSDIQGNPTPLTSLYKTLAPVQGQGKESDSQEFYLFKPEKKPGSKETNYKLVAGPIPSRHELLTSGYVKKWQRENCSAKQKNKKQEGCPVGKGGTSGEVPKGHKVLFVPGNIALVKCTADARYCPGVPSAPTTTYYYLFKYYPHGTADSGPVTQMTGSDLNLKGTKQDCGTQGADQGQPLVLMAFTNAGAKKFHDVTRTLAERGRTKFSAAGSPNGQEDNYAQQFAIVVANITHQESQGLIDVGEPPPGENLEIRDRLSEGWWRWARRDLKNGLYVKLAGGDAHVLIVADDQKIDAGAWQLQIVDPQLVQEARQRGSRETEVSRGNVDFQSERGLQQQKDRRRRPGLW